MNINRTILGAILFLFCAALTAIDADEPMRRWRTRFGGVLTGVWQRDLDEPDGSLIRIRSLANLYRVRVEDLTPEDQWYVLSQRAIASEESEEPEKVSSTQERRSSGNPSLVQASPLSDTFQMDGTAPIPEADLETNTNGKALTTDSDEGVAASGNKSLAPELAPVPEHLNSDNPDEAFAAPSEKSTGTELASSKDSPAAGKFGEATAVSSGKSIDADLQSVIESSVMNGSDEAIATSRGRSLDAELLQITETLRTDESDEAFATSSGESLDAEFIQTDQSSDTGESVKTAPKQASVPLMSTDAVPLESGSPVAMPKQDVPETDTVADPGTEEESIGVAGTIGNSQESHEQEQLPPDIPGSHAGERRVYEIAGISYAFRWCPSGVFMMGSPDTELGHTDDEIQHEVTLTRGFWILETEVTQQMWTSVFTWNPCWFSKTGTGAAKVRQVETGNLPVEQVTWGEAIEFCRKLQSLSGMPIVLPTEAEWEYACRAGTQTVYSFGDTIQFNDANYYDSVPGNIAQNRKIIRNPYPVGTFPPNAWGIRDMHGNVAEWCRDYFAPFEVIPAEDPIGPATGINRVFRGGSWFLDSNCCRSAYRFGIDPDTRAYYLGFRIIIEP